MSILRSATLICVLVTGLAGRADPGLVQIADLRLPPETFAGRFTYFDPGFGPLATRPVAGAPVSVACEFFGTTQQVSESGPDDNDLALRTYHGVLMIHQLSRYNVDEKDRIRRIGVVQWRLDLEALASHLAREKSDLRSLELRLVEGEAGNGGAYFYDIYVSPGGVGTASLPVDIDRRNPEENYRALWLPALERKVGDVFPHLANDEGDAPGFAGRKVLIVRQNKSVVSPEAIVIDLLPQYRAGARRFGLILAGGTYGKGRSIKIQEGSGLYYMADPVR